MEKLSKGCVVMMKSSSGMIGYGNPQCVSSYIEELGEVSFYGHNQLYKDYDIAEIIEHPSNIVDVAIQEKLNRETKEE